MAAAGFLTADLAEGWIRGYPVGLSALAWLTASAWL
jgi:hypothetical protein